MPYTFIQFKKRFEPAVKGFDGFASASVDATNALVLLVCLACFTKPTAVGAAFVRPSRFLFRTRMVARVLRTQKSSSRAASCRRPFHRFAETIGVVPTVSGERLRLLRQSAQLRLQRANFCCARRIHRGQQRKHGRLGRGRHDDFVTVPINPTVMLGVAPRRRANAYSGYKYVRQSDSSARLAAGEQRSPAVMMTLHRVVTNAALDRS